MSGGHFDYAQYKITEIADGIESVIRRNGKEIPEGDNWFNREWIEEHPEDAYYPEYSEEIIAAFKRAVVFLFLWLERMSNCFILLKSELAF